MTDTVAVITGASSGIGRDLALTLARQGSHNLVLTGRDQQRLDAVADRCTGVRTLAMAADLATPGAVSDLVRTTLDTFGRIDLLVASAGLYLGDPFAVSDPDTIRLLLDTNITSTIGLVRAACPAMVEAGSGDIVLVTSVSGYQDIEWEPVYSASKHAMTSFAHTLRRQLAGTGVRVMSIGPGVVLTELWGYRSDDERIGEVAGSGKGIAVGEVTEAITWMLSRPRGVTIRDLVILPSAQDI